MIDINMGDILFVTGHDMTNEWATTIIGESIRDLEIKIGGGDGMTVSGSAWGSWSSSVQLQIPPRFGPASGCETILRLSSNEHGNEADRPPPDQCIFLRAFRVVERLPKSFPGKIKAAAHPKDNGRDFDEENDTAEVVRAGVDSDSNDASDDDSTRDGDLEAQVSIASSYRPAVWYPSRTLLMIN